MAKGMKESSLMSEKLGSGGPSSGDHVLELSNVFHTGQVEPGSCFQKVTGSVPKGTVLKDVSVEVHAGEVMAILGSKGSGKRALLEVIGRRAQGITRGQILLNEVCLTVHLFQEQCSFVPCKVQLLPGLSVRQTLQYSAELTIGSKVAAAVKRGRVKQVMADLALNQIANKEISTLKPSEYQRVSIAIQLVKDPVMILLDDPTCDLDPLNTYFIISILSNHAKKYDRIVVLSMEKPRSDIFPFLDRVTYLSLGEVVYTGSTRMLLDYFGSIGFPCPELENPLMYYLCLSTVDRRTRERFIESSSQIAALVEKFKLEGVQYQKYYLPLQNSGDKKEVRYKLPLTAYGPPPSYQVLAALISRRFSLLRNCNRQSLQETFLRLFLPPAFFILLYAFYFVLRDYQHSFTTRTGLIFNCIVAISFISAATTAISYAPHRTRYYQETREGLYRGPLFILSSILYSTPLSLIAVFCSGTVIYLGSKLHEDWEKWVTFCIVLWSLYVFAEHQTIALMMVVKSPFTAFISSIYILITYIVFGTGTVRSFLSLPKWLYYVSYGVVFRYAGAFLQQNEFSNNYRLKNAAFLNYTSTPCLTNIPGYCVYVDGDHYLSQRYHNGSRFETEDLQYWLNFGICFVFVTGIWIMNIVLYLLPLPMFIKIKFRN